MQSERKGERCIFRLQELRVFYHRRVVKRVATRPVTIRQENKLGTRVATRLDRFETILYYGEIASSVITGFLLISVLYPRKFSRIADRDES